MLRACKVLLLATHASGDEQNAVKMIPPRIELGAFCVLGRCDNRYTTESQMSVRQRRQAQVRPVVCERPLR
jgi:hypothetical protein